MAGTLPHKASPRNAFFAPHVSPQPTYARMPVFPVVARLDRNPLLKQSSVVMFLRNRCPSRPGKVWLFGLAAALTLACGSASAADWPMFHGNPSLTGIATGVVPDKPVRVWSYKTGRAVKSSPAVVQNRVFVGSDDKTLHAIDLNRGNKLWTCQTGGEVESSPLVLEDRVYFGSNDGSLYCVEAATGKKIWTYATGDKIPGAPNWFRSGTNTWVLVGSYDYKLHCVDAATGKSNWVYETSNYINGAPAVHQNQAVFGGCDGLLHIVGLEDGKEVKTIEAGAYIGGSVALAAGRAYFGQYENLFMCVDLKLGTNIWTYKNRNFPYFATPAVTEDKVIFGGRDKRIHCARRDTGDSLWSFATRGMVDSSPVVCGNRVIAGSSDGRVYILDLATGKEIWSYEIGESITSSPAVVDGKIVVGSEDGIVYCFGSKS